MWVVFFGILWLLRDFFSVMFLTFILGFVMRKVARFLVNNMRAPYWAAVVFPYLLALGLLVLLMMTTIPRVVDEGVEFSRKAPQLLYTLAEEVKKTAQRYSMEPVLAKYVAGDEPVVAVGDPSATAEPTTRPVIKEISPAAIVRRFMDTVSGVLPKAEGGEHRLTFTELFLKFAAEVTEGAIKFLLAILLSFLIVLDFDRLKHELSSWRTSTVGKFFHEAASSVVEFSEVVGTAFQCQLVVALLNAAITSVGLTVLDIQPVLLLTTIVFLWGLIPVLGVWISSVPIVLIAFNDHGLGSALAAIGLITGVHLIEAYVLNPRIYAARFHLNPVIVLIILLVGHELFGVWGMLLGIPVTHYVLNIAQVPSIPKKTRRVPEPAMPVPLREP
jgi:predicted PurR-regulated permease PerM